MTHSLDEPLAIFRAHTIPMFAHVPPKIAAMASVVTKSTEENPAKHQQPQPLPVADRMPPEELRHQPIP